MYAHMSLSSTWHTAQPYSHVCTVVEDHDDTVSTSSGLFESAYSKSKAQPEIEGEKSSRQEQHRKSKRTRVPV